MTAASDDNEMAALAEYLRSLGVAPDDVPDTPWEASAKAADAVLAGGDTMSLSQLTERAGLDLESVASAMRHLGLRVDDHDAVMFGDADVELARFVDTALRLLTEEDCVEFLHVVSTSLSTIAEAAISVHIQGPESRAVDYLENAKLNAAMSELGLSLGSQLANGFRHHLRQSVSRQRRVQSHRYREVQELTIGFVDLVGFTSLSQTLDPDGIVALVTDFESRAHELAHEHDVRVVKLIGDEVMFVAEQPPEAARFTLGMLDAFATSMIVPRGGVASGSLITVHGDYFGPVVNLAARLVDTAVPGEILVDDTVAEACDRSTEPAGRRMLKGFDEPVRVHTLVAEVDP